MKIVEFKDYDNQTTPLSAYNLNRLQQNLITTKYQMTFSSAVSGGSTITLPCYYQVGQDTLDVYLNSELLKKASTKDSEGHYYEVGNSDTKSNQIKITSDWSIASGDVLNLIVRGTTDSYDQNLSPDKATQLADEISANKEEITALQTENSRLKGITNALPKISGEDTSLTLTNTANAPLSDIILKGNTSQKTTTGKNLIKLYKATNPLVTNGLTFTRLDDNTLKIKGTSVLQCWIEVLYNLKNGTDVQTTPLFNLDVDNNYVFIAKNLSGTKDKDPTIYLQPNKENKTVSALPNTSISFSNSDGIYRGWIYIQANTNFNDYTLQFQLEEGTTPTDFEPYTNGASPNPDYPQDIKVVTGDNTINIINSNIYNLTINVTKTDYGFINNTAIPALNSIKLKKGIKYLFSLQLKSKPTTDTTFSIYFKGSPIGESFSHIESYELNKTYTIEYTSPEDSYLSFHIWGNANNDIFEFRLWINVNEAQEFEFYNTQSFPISLGSLELCKIGDYQDYFYKSGSIWYLHKEINKITSYNGETITTSYISTTGELSTGAKVYYVVTPTDTKITDTTLISQLNALYNAYTYNDTTNITQTNANLPFIINAEAFISYEKLESKQDKLIAGTGIEITEENTINNIQGNYSTDEIRIGTWMGKPLYRKVTPVTTSTTFNYNTWVELNTINVNSVSQIIECKYFANLGYTMPLIAYRSDSRVLNVMNLRNTTIESSNFKILLEYTKTTD